MHSIRRLGLLLFLPACISQQFDLEHVKVAVLVEEDVPHRDAVRDTLFQGILQLGGTPTLEAGYPLIRVRFASNCCLPDYAACVRPENNTVIYTCITSNDPSVATSNALHEMGHVFGAGHLPCETGALMTHDAACRTIRDHFGPLDISAICQSGLVIGGICN